MCIHIGIRVPKAQVLTPVFCWRNSSRCQMTFAGFQCRFYVGNFIHHFDHQFHTQIIGKLIHQIVLGARHLHAILIKSGGAHDCNHMQFAFFFDLIEHIWFVRTRHGQDANYGYRKESVVPHSDFGPIKGEGAQRTFFFYRSSLH